MSDEPRLEITRVTVQEIGRASPLNVIGAGQDWFIHIEWKSTGVPEETLQTYHYAHDINIRAGEVAAGKYRVIAKVVYEIEPGRPVADLGTAVFGPELELL